MQVSQIPAQSITSVKGSRSCDVAEWRHRALQVWANRLKATGVDFHDILVTSPSVSCKNREAHMPDMPS